MCNKYTRENDEADVFPPVEYNVTGICIKGKRQLCVKRHGSLKSNRRLSCALHWSQDKMAAIFHTFLVTYFGTIFVFLYFDASFTQRSNGWYVCIGWDASLEPMMCYSTSLWWVQDYVWFKGSNMIVCVLLVPNSQGCCLAALRDHHFSTATNIQLIKSNLKFEPEATTAYVAMSPRYLGCKYHSRLHPRSRKCACQFLREIERVKSNCPRPASSASRGNNDVDHAVCLKAEFHMHTVLSNVSGNFYTIMIYPCFRRSVCFSVESLAWWRFGLWSSGSSLVSRWHDAPLVREFQMWRFRCNQIDPHWFEGRQMCFWWMWSTTSWKYFIMYQVRLFSTANI